MPDDSDVDLPSDIMHDLVIMLAITLLERPVNLIAACDGIAIVWQ
jgi:hypothetical protein